MGCEGFHALRQCLLRAVEQDLRQRLDSPTLHFLVVLPIDLSERELDELGLDYLLLLFQGGQLGDDVVRHPAQRICDRRVKAHGRFSLRDAKQELEEPRNELSEVILEDCSSCSVLRDLLLHLRHRHVRIEVSQRSEEEVHTVVVCNLGRHELLQLLPGEVNSRATAKELQYGEQHLGEGGEVCLLLP